MTRTPSKIKISPGVHLLEAEKHQKERFIKNASKSQLSRFVVDPVSSREIGNEYSYGSVRIRSKLTSQTPGDIGTSKTNLVQYGKNPTHRFDYKSSLGEDPHEKRFDPHNNKLESLSKYKKQSPVNFERFT